MEYLSRCRESMHKGSQHVHMAIISQVQMSNLSLYGLYKYIRAQGVFQIRKGTLCEAMQSLSMQFKFLLLQSFD